MPIKIPPKGQTERAALAGQIIGKYRAAQQEIERTERIQARLQSIAAQKEMAEFGYQLALDRAKFNATMDLEEEKRSRTWELEKMELRSRIDFEKEERKRIQNEEEYEAGVRIINESNMPDLEKEKQLFRLRMKKEADMAVSIPKETEKRISEADLARATKFLGEYEEPKWYQPLMKEPTEAEKAMKTHYEQLLGKAGITSQVPYYPAAALPTPKTKAEYDALPPGTKYIHPQLGERVKQ